MYFAGGGALNATVRYHAEEQVENAVFGFAISDSSGRIVHGSNTQVEGMAVPLLDGDGIIELRLRDLPMARGAYMFSFSVHSADHKKNYHRLDNCFPIAIECEKEFEGYTYMPSSWRVEA